jgi:hypothetical protein
MLQPWINRTKLAIAKNLLIFASESTRYSLEISFSPLSQVFESGSVPAAETLRNKFKGQEYPINTWFYRDFVGAIVVYKAVVYKKALGRIKNRGRSPGLYSSIFTKLPHKYGC